MKTLILTILTIGIIPLSYANEVNINCEDRASASSIKGNGGDSFLKTIFLRHNFAAAELKCSTALSYAIDDKQTFRCAGVWGFDLNRPDETLGTVAIAEFTHINEDKWSAQFTTSHDYDRQELTIECEITNK